ncbi:hypothetical protein BS47DRAFT_1428124 [Hydnum rufescens UP504]|uniref:Uncharacterized protein n=1 Tax=Hydnum rufescens UP504 TaxID=1448309 RepID=A0A9P6DM11_9AGAM|nr:hypothetical protein BS47DRAFT_1428124 [Hydnum rufescens UP504]
MRPDITIRSDPEALPEELDFLATDLHTFLECLNQIPEFTDEGVNSTALSFHNDLKYWASGLQEYKGQFRCPSVERYVNDLTKEMEEHLQNLTRALTTFVDVGVPTIRFTQRHTADALQNLSTVATFFSAVTATTLQYSYQSFQTRTEEAVNLLWIMSLVFSLASAINSQLAYHWRSAIYRSPRSCVPWWVSIWITRTPLLFLVSSVIAFSAGLVCFTYATFYSSPFIPIIITVCTSISSFALFAVGLWFAGERYAFAKSKGRKLYTGYQWLASHFPGDTFDYYLVWMRGRLKKLFHGLHWALSLLFRQNVSISSLENGRTNTGECGMSTDGLPYSNPLSGELVFPSRSNTFQLPQACSRVARSTPPRNSCSSWLHLLLRLPGYPIADVQGSPPFGSRNIGSLEAARAKRRPSRLAMVIPALRAFSTTQYLSEHTAPVCHLQFSPNGEFFATCSWDRTAIIWKVGNPFQIHRKLAHAKGFADQVAWSPDGKYLLTKMSHGVKIWVTETGVCQRTIGREHDVQSVVWMPSGDGFFTIEGTTVYKMSLNGHLDWSHNFARLSLRDVVVTPDEHRFLAVAILEQTRDGNLITRSSSCLSLSISFLRDGIRVQTVKV